MTTPDDPYAAPDPGSTPPPSSSSPYGRPPTPAPGYGRPQTPAPGYGQPQTPPGYGPAAGAPGQPLYGQPAYGPPTGYPQYGQTAPQGTSGLAIASLVCAIAGVITCGIASIVGFILGLVALSQIKRTRQNGRGLALAGVWVSSILIVLGIIAGIVLGVYVSGEVKKCDNGTYTGQDYQNHCVDDDF